MGGVSKLIRELMEYSRKRKGEISDLTARAAETISLLSKKLQSETMQRSMAYFHSGWIPADMEVPPDEEFVLVQFSGIVPRDKHVARTYEHTFSIGNYFDGEGWYINELPNEEEMKLMTVEAWMPLPEGYVPDNDVGKAGKNGRTGRRPHDDVAEWTEAPQ